MVLTWWLISDEDADLVRAFLLKEAPEDNERKDALHTLDSGLYQTLCVPSDFQEAVEKEKEY